MIVAVVAVDDDEIEGIEGGLYSRSGRHISPSLQLFSLEVSKAHSPR